MDSEYGGCLEWLIFVPLFVLSFIVCDIVLLAVSAVWLPGSGWSVFCISGIISFFFALIFMGEGEERAEIGQPPVITMLPPPVTASLPANGPPTFRDSV